MNNNDIVWWEASSILQGYVNNRISGNPSIGWIEYTLNKFYSNHLPVANCLSFGCGRGEVEFELDRLGAFRDCDAYEDIGEKAVQDAIHEATARMLKNIHYYVASMNEVELPKTNMILFGQMVPCST